MPNHRLPTYFISHGGGPWPYMKAEMGGAYDRLEASLQQMPKQIGTTPKAVLMISGHWEEREFTVMATKQPPMIYDYSGFPEHTYHVRYAAPGSPATAERVRGLLEGAGIAVRVDTERGFDHGTFSPLAVIYPDADVPVLQLSLKVGYDPAQHIFAGRALAPLRDEGVLIVGSGLSYHNLRAVRAGREGCVERVRPLARPDAGASEPGRAHRTPAALAGGTRRASGPSARRPPVAADGRGRRCRRRPRDPRLPSGRLLRRHRGVELHVRRLTGPANAALAGAASRSVAARRWIRSVTRNRGLCP